MRWKQYKIIRSLTKGPVEWGPGDSRIVAWPAPAPTPVAFGASGGTIGKDLWPAGPDKQDHCRAAIGKRELGAVRCYPYCLFDLETDPSESNDLHGSAAYAAIAQEMSRKLDAHGTTGRDPKAVHVFRLDAHGGYEQQMCARAMESGLLTPLDEPGDQNDP